MSTLTVRLEIQTAKQFGGKSGQLRLRLAEDRVILTGDNREDLEKKFLAWIDQASRPREVAFLRVGNRFRILVRDGDMFGVLRPNVDEHGLLPKEGLICLTHASYSRYGDVLEVVDQELVQLVTQDGRFRTAPTFLSERAAKQANELFKFYEEEEAKKLYFEQPFEAPVEALHRLTKKFGDITYEAVVVSYGGQSDYPSDRGYGLVMTAHSDDVDEVRVCGPNTTVWGVDIEDVAGLTAHANRMLPFAVRSARANREMADL